jgi:Putative zinc-finger
MRPHDEFIELCAVSTTGTLTAVEQEKLDEHLAVCPSCRQILREYQSSAEIALPLFATVSRELLPQGNSVDDAESVLMARLGHVREAEMQLRAKGVDAVRVGSYWNYMWLAFGATVVLVGALGVFAYKMGVKHSVLGGVTSVPASGQAASAAPVNPVTIKPDSTKEELPGLAKSAEELRLQLAKRTEEVAQLRQERVALEGRAKQSDEERQRVAGEQATINAKLQITEAMLEETKNNLETLKNQRASDDGESIAQRAKIESLAIEVRDKEHMIEEQQELLAHDRDIRELMGARDLYIAEVFDVAKNGATEKPYGRVFFTKGKSLIFYAFDLDRKSGFRNTNSFQVWGQRGADRQDSLSLGIFYEDSVSKKRWVLKSNDSQKLEEIDAVFVTVEPRGGSQRPSGKPLLYAYLKVRPNHP